MKNSISGIFKFISLGFASLLLLSCNSDSFEGKYAAIEDAKPSVIIEKDKDSYVCSVYFDSGKKSFQDMKYIPENKMIKLFGENYSDFIESGIYYGMFFVLKVKKGATFEGRTFKSDYYFIFGVTSNDLYKL
jgi:hypothetical protein